MQKYAQASDIKVGVIGYGGAFNMGRKHLQEMSRAGMTPFAVTELDPERLKVAEEDFPGIETGDSVDAMLEKSAVDLTVLITPHNTHAPLSLRRLQAGKHVVTEKPFAITTDQCDEMIAQTQRRGLMLSTYHDRHWVGASSRRSARSATKVPSIRPTGSRRTWATTPHPKTGGGPARASPEASCPRRWDWC